MIALGLLKMKKIRTNLIRVHHIKCLINNCQSMTIMLSALFNLRSTTKTLALESPIPNLNYSALTQSRTEALCPERLHSHDAPDLVRQQVSAGKTPSRKTVLICSVKTKKPIFRGPNQVKKQKERVIPGWLSTHTPRQSRATQRSMKCMNSASLASNPGSANY